MTNSGWWIVQRAAVTVAMAGCLVAVLVGIGLIGTSVDRSAGGALAADATLIAPAGPAFSIWTVIYLGLIGYTVWQWRSSAVRVERTRWLAVASIVLNGLWLLVVQLGWLWASVLVIAALLVVLGILVRRLSDEAPASGRLERVLLDGTFGLYLGWVAVATCANVTAFLTAIGVRPASPGADVAAVALIIVVGGVAAWLAARLGGRWAVAAAMAWGLGWIAVGRFTGDPGSVPTAVAAVAAALLALAAAGFARTRRRPGSGQGPANLAVG